MLDQVERQVMRSYSKSLMDHHAKLSANADRVLTEIVKLTDPVSLF